MHTTRFFTPILQMLLFCTAVSGFITTHGPLPSQVDISTLEREYGRMWRVVAPRQRMIETPLHLFFFQSRDRLPTAQWLPEWGGGGASGPDTIVIPVDKIPFYGQNLQQTCFHEIAHCILSRAYPDAGIPRWFHEGAAMTLAGEISFDEMMLLSQAFLFNHQIPLDAIDTVNNMNESRARLAYAQGHAIVLFLIDTYGMDAIEAILTKAQRRHGFWPGLFDEMGLEKEEFSRLALDKIRSRYGLMFIFGDNWFWWMGIAILFLAVFLITQIRNRKKRQQMEQEENNSPWPETETASMADGALVNISVPALFRMQSADHVEATGTETGNIDADSDYPDQDEDDEPWDEEFDSENDDDREERTRSDDDPEPDMERKP